MTNREAIELHPDWPIPYALAYEGLTRDESFATFNFLFENKLIWFLESKGIFKKKKEWPSAITILQSGNKNVKI